MIEGKGKPGTVGERTEDAASAVPTKSPANRSVSVPLTRGLVALIDEEDFERVSAIKWHAVETEPGRFYAASRVRGTGRKVKMHRFVLGAPDDMVVDHINWNPLDNRRENLRLATASQNMRNMRKVAPSSGFRGVHKTPRVNGFRWRAMIRKDGKVRHLGDYDDPVEAAKAYDKALLEIAGDYAATNAKLGLV